MLAAARTDIDCAVSYYGVGLDAFLERGAIDPMSDGFSFRR